MADADAANSAGGSIAVSITGPRIAATVSGARSSIATVRNENGRPNSTVSPLRQRRVNLAKLPRSALICAVLPFTAIRAFVKRADRQGALAQTVAQIGWRKLLLGRCRKLERDSFRSDLRPQGIDGLKFPVLQQACAGGDNLIEEFIIIYDKALRLRPSALGKEGQAQNQSR